MCGYVTDPSVADGLRLAEDVPEPWPIRGTWSLTG